MSVECKCKCVFSAMKWIHESIYKRKLTTEMESEQESERERENMMSACKYRNIKCLNIKWWLLQWKQRIYDGNENINWT